MRDPRLGDDIDDFCVRCKRVMNHSVVSVVDNKPAKVRCRICHSDHDFRNEQPPPPKVDLRKQALFTEVLKKVSPADAAAVGDVDPELPAEVDELEADDAEAIGESEVEVEAAAEPEPVIEEPKPKAKAKAKATSRKK